MKDFGKFLMLLASVLTTHFPMMGYTKTYFQLKPIKKVQPAEQPTSLGSHLQSVIEHLNGLEGESNFGRYYNELEPKMEPKYREFVLSKLNKNKKDAWRDLPTPKIERDGEVVYLSIPDDPSIKVRAEFFAEGEIAMKVNGYPILRTEVENPALVFSKIFSAIQESPRARQPARSAFSFIMGLMISEAHAGLGLLIVGVLVGVLLGMMLSRSSGGYGSSGYGRGYGGSFGRPAVY